MSQDAQPTDSKPPGSGTHSIAMLAEMEAWQNLRGEIRQRLTGTITVGVLYLLASLAVGAYLILKVSEVGRDVVVLDHWEPSELPVQWVIKIAWAYAILAAIAIAAYGLLMMWVQGNLPTTASRVMGLIPAIGSTVQMVSAGDFCQSMYQSVADSRTYPDALTVASKDVRDASLRAWLVTSGQRMASGQSLASVLVSAPMRVAPLSAMSAFTPEQLTQEESVRLWHHATSECHLQAQSRLSRAIQVVSVSCLVVSVSIAAFAMLVGTVFMMTLIQGLT
ncbi:hypothetical protein SAMN06265222_10681 [Neorhodopirellula lusitana]|uniref:Uncharacterized protein n=1 Tax=Neorhodopirellula lusitana TaxID=445327 RepID=A0ABY1Q460_9BACT|nr:hypothetical protein [Neorhodopirellula lusitana]SMP58626.1 hypothetical protein SAMN06265222_10681 [Neorhodopirellula lusitana]